MTVIRILLTIVDVLCALLLVGVILLQKSRNEGMGGMAFGAGMGEALFGSRTGNVLTRATVTLAGIFLGSNLLLAVLNPSATSERSIIDETVPDIPAAPGVAPAPTAPVETPVAAAPAAAPAGQPAPASAPLVTLPAPVAAPAPVAPAPAPAPAATP